MSDCDLDAMMADTEGLECIGGPQDGRIVEVPRGTPGIQFPPDPPDHRKRWVCYDICRVTDGRKVLLFEGMVCEKS